MKRFPLFLFAIVPTVVFAQTEHNQSNSTCFQNSENSTLTETKSIDGLNSEDFGEGSVTFYDILHNPEVYSAGNFSKELNVYVALLKFVRRHYMKHKSLIDYTKYTLYRKEVTDELKELFVETLLNGTFFEDCRVNAIDWHELSTMELQTLNEKSQMSELFLQRTLSTVISQIYRKLNVSDLIERTSNYKDDNLNKQNMKKAHMLGAMFKAINEHNDKQNSNLFKLAYALKELIEVNGFYWGSDYFQTYTESIRRLFPVCIKKIVFTNNELFTVKNPFYNAFMVTTTNFKDVYLEQKPDSFDHYKWIIKFNRNLFSIQTSNGQYYLNLDGSYIEASRGNELILHILPSPIDDSKCIIQHAQKGTFLCGVPDKSLIKIGNGPSPLWTAKYLWEIDIV